MFILRPSSPIHAPVASPEATTAVVPAAVGYVDEGFPLPEGYEVDIIRAVLQDPFRIFAYWEIRDKSLASLTKYFSPEEAAGFRVVLRLLELSGNHEAFFEVPSRGRYWITVFPDREYEFEIGVMSPAHGYISLVRSNRVTTPRGTVSPFADEEPQYRLNAPDFINVLQASGFGSEEALNLTLAGAPGAKAVDTDAISTALIRYSEELRDVVLFAGGGGELSQAQIALLPEPLRSELLKLFLSGGGRMASIGLLHYLPELLRELVESGYEWVGDQTHPLHLAPRFLPGGSENLTWPGGELKWPGGHHFAASPSPWRQGGRP